jgi:inorganic pyrophosphatase
VDILVAGRNRVIPGAVVRVRPIGTLILEDEAGMDEKILAVPVDALHPYFPRVSSFLDLPQILLDQIKHFFQHYRDLEKDKWVKAQGWAGADEAFRLIEASIKRAAEENDAK